jgi:hypothetical protein
MHPLTLALVCLLVCSCRMDPISRIQTVNSVSGEYLTSPCPKDSGVKQQVLLRQAGAAIADGRGEFWLRVDRPRNRRQLHVRASGPSASVAISSRGEGTRPGEESVLPVAVAPVRKLGESLANVSVGAGKLGWDTPSGILFWVGEGDARVQLELMSQDQWLLRMPNCEGQVILPELHPLLLDLERSVSQSEERHNATKTANSKGCGACAVEPSYPSPWLFVAVFLLRFWRKRRFAMRG